jgi:hypothetical protein
VVVDGLLETATDTRISTDGRSLAFDILGTRALRTWTPAAAVSGVLGFWDQVVERQVRSNPVTPVHADEAWAKLTGLPMAVTDRTALDTLGLLAHGDPDMVEWFRKEVCAVRHAWWEAHKGMTRREWLTDNLSRDAGATLTIWRSAHLLITDYGDTAGLRGLVSLVGKQDKFALLWPVQTIDLRARQALEEYTCVDSPVGEDPRRWWTAWVSQNARGLTWDPNKRVFVNSPSAVSPPNGPNKSVPARVRCE